MIRSKARKHEQIKLAAKDASLTLAFDDDVGTFLHCLLFLSGYLPVGLAEFFDIFTSLVSLEKVFERSAVEMVATWRSASGHAFMESDLLNVVESVLSNVTNDQVGVLPDFTTHVWLSLTDKELDKGRFA